MKKTLNEAIEEMVKEFEKEFHFSDADSDVVNIHGTALRNQLVDFLRSALLSISKKSLDAVETEEKETGIKMYPDKKTGEMVYEYGNSPSSQCSGCGQIRKAEEQGFNQAISEMVAKRNLWEGK